MHDKELLAIIDCFKAWRHHLVGAQHKVTVLCDHRNLAFFRDKVALSQRHARWAQLLADYDFVIEYRLGALNGRADALSRRPNYEPSGDAASNGVSVLQAGHFRIAATKTCPPGVLHITELDERCRILRERHNAPVAGHFGQAKTFDLVVRDFWWLGMRAQINDFVQRCDTCQRNKVPRHRPAGLLQPLPVPPRPWAFISIWPAATTRFLLWWTDPPKWRTSSHATRGQRLKTSQRCLCIKSSDYIFCRTTLAPIAVRSSERSSGSLFCHPSAFARTCRQHITRRPTAKPIASPRCWRLS